MIYKVMKRRNVTMKPKMTDPEIVRRLKDARSHLKNAMGIVRETRKMIDDLLGIHEERQIDANKRK